MEKTKCSFCVHHTQSGCTVRPNSWYCKEAIDEYYAWLNRNRKPSKVKSIYEKNNARRGKK